MTDVNQIDIKCLSLNVRGIRNNVKRKKLFHWLEEQKVDIIFLQETFCTTDLQIEIERDWKGKVINAPSDSSHSRGCMILLDKKLKCEIIDTHPSLDGRKLLANVLLNEHVYTVVCCYAPNTPKDRIKYFEGLQTWISQYTKNDQLIICAGDFNCIDDIRDRQTRTLDSSSKHFTQFKKNSNLYDTWRPKNPDIMSYTYIDPQNKHSSRIDYILSTERLLTCVQRSVILTSPAPDHKAVLTVFRYNVKTRGTGYWKLNNSVINEEPYVLLIESIIDRTINEYNNCVSYGSVWDLIKLRVKEASIKYCTNRKRKERNIKQGLENIINRIDFLIQNNTNCVEIDELINQRKRRLNELDRFYLQEAQGAQIRSRAKWVEDGEKSSAYFFRLETARQENNTINSLKSPEGNIETKDTKILEIAADFYTNLFKSCTPDAEDIEKYLNSMNDIKMLKEEEMIQCEGHISETETEKAIKSMKTNKSPGPDGLTVEFYVKFWNKIGPVLVKVYNESYQNGNLIPTQKEAIITLLYKGGDRTAIENYRPISLTNVDYKILAFVLSNRLQKVIGNIVSSDQSGYIKGRYIGNNIRLIEDLIEQCGKNDTKGTLLFLDFKKAFDSLEWMFMFKVLEKFKFGQTFIKWVKILYTSPTFKVKNNGYLSSEIEMTRGVRQGCPLSALLFVLSVEILAENIRQSNDIKGINMAPYGFNKEARISQYADDSILILESHKHVDKAIVLVEAFSKVSGLELNLKKTQGILLGADRSIPADSLNKKIVWTNDPIRCLGIYVGYDRKKCEESNWEKRIHKIQSILDSWKRRDLTLLGKILVVKTLIIPQLIFVACNSVAAYHLIPKLNKMIYSFIWPTRERIKRNTLIGPKDEGGLQMTHLESLFDALKASWIKRVIMVDVENPPTWSIIPIYILNKLGKNFLVLYFNLDSDILPILNTLPSFYSQIIKAWNKAKPIKIPESKEWLNEIIWGNKFFTVKVKKSQQSLYFKNWIDAGIIFVKDLVINSSVIDETFVYKVLSYKINFFHEMTIVKKALKSVLKSNNIDNTPVNVTNNISNYGNGLHAYELKTKKIYIELVKRHFEKPNIATKWNVADSQVTRNAFILKVKSITETKLAEFGYKVLHKILACPANLKIWKITDCDECSLCMTKDDINHLLIDCRVSKFIWKCVFNNLELELDDCKEIVLFGHKNKNKNYIVSLIAYLIYKYWILQNKNGKSKDISTLKYFMQNELTFRLRVYKTFHGNDNLTEILGNLNRAIREIC